MTKLADDIIRKVLPPNWLSGLRRNDLEAAQDFLRTALISGVPVIDVSNVADYAWSQREHWSTTDKDQFPCLAPPSPMFWTEYRRPSVFVHERDDLKDPNSHWNKDPKGPNLGGRWVQANTDNWLIESYGALWDTLDLRTQDISELPLPFTGQEDGENPLKDWVPKGARWFLRGTLYIKQKGMKEPMGPMAYWLGALDDQGVLMKDAALGMPDTTAMDPETHFYWKSMLLPTFMPMLRAICYMHVKNIEQVRQRPPAKLSKKYQKHAGRPLLTYRTLVIQPMTQGKKKEGVAGGGGGAKSHHFVRGHFADYRHGNGLFGKYKAIFWFDLATRGSRQVGEVMGEYEVKAPDQEAVS